MHMGIGGLPMSMHVWPAGQVTVAQLGGGAWLAMTLSTKGAVMTVDPRWNWRNIL
jgi:hypothetical protein